LEEYFKRSDWIMRDVVPGNDEPFPETYRKKFIVMFLTEVAMENTLFAKLQRKNKYVEFEFVDNVTSTKLRSAKSVVSL
jgi:hypothetical protein